MSRVYEGDISGLAPRHDVEAALTAERDRIAVQLHDGAGQTVAALALLLRREADCLPARSPLRARISRLSEHAERAKREIDRVTHDLAPPDSARSLAAVVEDLARTIELDSGIRITVSVVGDEPRLGPRLHATLVRIARGALMNVWRHADASTAEVLVRYTRGAVALTVCDDGVGIRSAVPGWGLASLESAVDELGGRLVVGPIDEGGAMLSVSIPVPG